MCEFTLTGSRGGNQKVVIILAANLGGGSPVASHFLIVGVLDVKNSGDWAMEKWSIKNKKDYAGRHGIYRFEKPLIRQDMNLSLKTCPSNESMHMNGESRGKRLTRYET
jgi:hypothetical protein